MHCCKNTAFQSFPFKTKKFEIIVDSMTATHNEFGSDIAIGNKRQGQLDRCEIITSSLNINKNKKMIDKKFIINRLWKVKKKRSQQTWMPQLMLVGLFC